MIAYNSYKNNGQKGMCAYVCVGKVGGGGGLASYVSKGAYRTVFKNLIRLKFNGYHSHQISNSNVFEM